MINKVIQTMLQNILKEGMNNKLTIRSRLQTLAKRYWRYLLFIFMVIFIMIILLIWLIWSLISGAISSGTTMIPNVVVPNLEKVEEVGINGIIEQPINFLQDIWYGKDGK